MNYHLGSNKFFHTFLVSILIFILVSISIGNYPTNDRHNRISSSQRFQIRIPITLDIVENRPSVTNNINDIAYHINFTVNQ